MFRGIRIDRNKTIICRKKKEKMEEGSFVKSGFCSGPNRHDVASVSASASASVSIRTDAASEGYLLGSELGRFGAKVRSFLEPVGGCVGSAVRRIRRLQP